MAQGLKITVWGKPIAQARPKFFTRKTKTGKVFSGAYSPQETDAGRFANAVANQLPSGFIPFTGPLELSARFVMPIPASVSKKKRAAMAAGETLPAKKPDNSNCVKWVEDCLNGVVWVDDSLICRILSEKVYGEHPRTEIEVRLIGGANGEQQVEPIEN